MVVIFNCIDLNCWLVFDKIIFFIDDILEDVLEEIKVEFLVWLVFGEDIIVYFIELSYVVNFEMVINEYKLFIKVVIFEEVIKVEIFNCKLIDEVVGFLLIDEN